MRLIATLLPLPLLFLCITSASSEDRIDSPLLRPDVILNNAGTLGLSDEQVESIQAIVSKAQPEAEALGPKASLAMERFAELLATDQVEEKAALQQLDEVLAIEKAQKRLHIRAMIRIRNELTASQRAAVESLQNERQVENGRGQSLRDKIRRIQQRARAMQQGGNDVSKIQQVMQQVGPLLQQGKTGKVEKLIDELLGELDDPQHSVQDPKEAIVRPGTRLQELSAQQVQAEVVSMKTDDVAWRQIPWKTCLLDGLQASREQDKPLMLWIFIDRPIDDERC